MRKFRKFGPGDKVFAKVRGYPPWPARIVGVADEASQVNKMRYHIYFYGTGESAVVKAEDVFLFVEHKNGKLGKPRKLKGFNEAIAEIEAELSPEEREQMLNSENNGDAADTSVLSDDGGALSTSRRSSTTMKPAKSIPNTPENNVPDSLPQTVDSAMPQAEAKTVKGRKRKSEVVETSSPEASEVKKVKQASAVPAEPSIEEENPLTKQSSDVMSRSGRKIKPKKFSDFDEQAETEDVSATNRTSKPSPTKTTERAKPAQSKKIEQEPVKGGDDYLRFVFKGEAVKIPLKSNRPVFKNPKSPIDWDQMVLKHALSLKEDVLSGEIAVEKVSKVMEDWIREKCVEMKQTFEYEDFKYSVLKIEGKLLQLDLKIKSSLTIHKAEPAECLKYLDEMLGLQISAIMLKKHPEVVETVKRMRRYVGNTSSWSFTDQELKEFNILAQSIRTKCDHIFNKFKNLFLVPQGETFWSVFSKDLAEFHKKTEHLPQEQLFAIVKEPF